MDGARGSHSSARRISRSCAESKRCAWFYAMSVSSMSLLRSEKLKWRGTPVRFFVTIPLEFARVNALHVVFCLPCAAHQLRGLLQSLQSSLTKLDARVGAQVLKIPLAPCRCAVHTVRITHFGVRWLEPLALHRWAHDGPHNFPVKCRRTLRDRLKTHSYSRPCTSSACPRGSSG